MVFLYELRCCEGVLDFKLQYKRYKSSSKKKNLYAFYPRLEFSNLVSTASDKNSVVNYLFCKTQKLPEYNFKLKPNLKQTQTALELTCLDF